MTSLGLGEVMFVIGIFRIIGGEEEESAGWVLVREWARDDLTVTLAYTDGEVPSQRVLQPSDHRWERLP